MANHGSHHPARIAFDAPLWFGPEVENDRRGIWTAFVSRRLDGAQVGRVEREADHLFLTEAFMDFAWLEEHLLPASPGSRSRSRASRTRSRYRRRCAGGRAWTGRSWAG